VPLPVLGPVTALRPRSACHRAKMVPPAGQRESFTATGPRNRLPRQPAAAGLAGNGSRRRSTAPVGTWPDEEAERVEQQGTERMGTAQVAAKITVQLACN
jgi:hypothetical protein